MIRQLEARDIEKIRECMTKEGAVLEEKELMPVNTYIWDDNGLKGFFYFRIEQNIPSLRHFLIKKEYRNIKNARMLLNEYCNIVNKMGFKNSIILVNKQYLGKLIEYKFKKKPYFKDKVWAYSVEV